MHPDMWLMRLLPLVAVLLGAPADGASIQSSAAGGPPSEVTSHLPLQSQYSQPGPKTRVIYATQSRQIDEGYGPGFMEFIAAPGEFFTSLMSGVSEMFMGTSPERPAQVRPKRQPVRYREVPNPYLNPMTGIPYSVNPQEPQFYQPRATDTETDIQFSSQYDHLLQPHVQQYLANDEDQFYPNDREFVLDDRYQQPYQSPYEQIHQPTYYPPSSSPPVLAHSPYYQPQYAYRNQFYKNYPTQTKAQEKSDGFWTGGYSSHYRQMNAGSSDKSIYHVPPNTPEKRSSPSAHSIDRADSLTQGSDSPRNLHSSNFNSNTRIPSGSSDTRSFASNVPTETFRYDDRVSDGLTTSASNTYYSPARGSSYPPKTTSPGRNIIYQRSQPRTTSYSRNMIFKNNSPRIYPSQNSKKVYSPSLSLRNQQYFVSANDVYNNYKNKFENEQPIDPLSYDKWESWGALVGKSNLDGTVRKNRQTPTSKPNLPKKKTTKKRSPSNSPPKTLLMNTSERQLHPVSDVVDALRIVVDALENTPGHEQIYLARTGEAVSRRSSGPPMVLES